MKEVNFSKGFGAMSSLPVYYPSVEAKIPKLDFSSKLMLDSDNLENSSINVKSFKTYLKPYGSSSFIDQERRLTFTMPPMQGIKHTFYGPEIDTFIFSFFRPIEEKINLFVEIQKKLIELNMESSFLINHFAECEKRNLPYEDPIQKVSLLKKNQYLVSNSSQVKDVYYTNGGFREIHRIIDLDPKFFSTLLLMHENLPYFVVEEVHSNVDTTCSLLNFLNQDIKKGRIHTAGRHLYAYGEMKGESFEGPIGRQSKNYSLISDEKNQFHLDSFYSGNKKRNKTVVCGYCKRKESMERYSSISKVEDRFEVRYQLKFYSSDELKFFHGIFDNYFSGLSYYYRAFGFLNVLNSQFIPTRIQRIKAEPSFSESISFVSPWWYDLMISPLQHIIELTGLYHNKTLKEKQNKKTKWSKTSNLYQGFESYVPVPSEFFELSNYENFNLSLWMKNFRHQHNLRPLFFNHNLTEFPSLWPSFCTTKNGFLTIDEYFIESTT